jgi:hypothetical protein
MHKVRADFHVLGVAPVHIAACGEEVGAEVFLSRLAEVALAARGGDPCHADALTCLCDADHLVSQNDRETRWGSPPFDLVQLGVTDSATRHAEEDFVRPRNRLGDSDPAQGSRMRVQVGEAFEELGFQVVS